MSENNDKTKPTILVCDDDEGIADVIKLVLEEKEYQVVTVTQSSAIYNQICKYHPQLIFLDLWMPHIDGQAIARKLKQDSDTNQIPIIIISANKDTAKINQELHTDGFLCKPFEIDDLEKLADQYLQA